MHIRCLRLDVSEQHTRPWRPRFYRDGVHCRSEALAGDVLVAEVEFLVADDLVGLVALARQQDHVVRAGALDRQAMALRRSGSTMSAPEPGSSKPARMSSMMASGSSVRGLSLVTRSGRPGARRRRAMRGRLVLSRSPPQPKRTMSRPRHSGRRVVRALAEGVVGVGVVDQDGERPRQPTFSRRPGTPRATTEGLYGRLELQTRRQAQPRAAR
jgi:hypothetical protein